MSDADEPPESTVDELDQHQVAIESVSNESFNDWYDERQFRQNILEGKPYFNGPSPLKPPERHTPSKLLQCHRKTTDRKSVV